MKNYSKILMLLLLPFISSCLKDKYNALDPEGSPSVVEFKNPDFISSQTPAGSLYSMYSTSLQSQPNAEQTYTIQVSGAEPASEDIIVEFGIDTSFVSIFNKDQKDRNTNWVFMDRPEPELYSIAQPSVVIPAGQRSVEVVVSYKTDQFDFDMNYAFPLVIKSTSFGSVSKNFGTIILNVGAKNQWDGVYSLEEGSFVTRYTAPGSPANDALSGSIAGNTDIDLVSVGANSLEIVGLKWAGNSSGVAGIDNLRLTIDPATNEVTMSALGNPTLANIASLPNKYDPDTQTFTLNFDWNQTSAPRVMGLVIKYSESR